MSRAIIEALVSEENTMQVLIEAVQALEAKIDTIANAMNANCEDEIMTIQQAAKFVCMSTHTIYQLTSRKEIPHYRKGRRLFFKKQELADWLTGKKIDSKDEIRQRAATYLATRRHS